MSAIPPLFQEASCCNVCHCSFTAFRRRHHCRCCGRTLCNEHSSNYMALPQFGIYTDVRVCSDCFNDSSRYGKGDQQTSPYASSSGTDGIARNSDASVIATNSLSKLVLGEDSALMAKAASGGPTTVVPECNCGMPLCICVAPTPEPPVVPQTSTISAAPPNPRIKKSSSSQQTVESSSKKVAASTNNSSSFFNLDNVSNSTLGKARVNYEVSGEGLREAIKNKDVTAVKELLSKEVDANYCDRQGLTLLHLAALFNQTEIAFILIDHGASTESRNAQGETPLDCAPTMLQFKMRQKIDELVSSTTQA